tara:strand:+ start:4958 stop:6076 length:1119 start_codon:yes stop_codon:yes gene_type:complete
MENKPNVFPSSDKMSEAMQQANDTGTKIAEQYNKEQNLNLGQKNQGELDADAKMKANTLTMLEEQMKKRDELMVKKRAEANGELVEDPYQTQETPKVTYASLENNVEHAKLEIPEDKYEKLSRPQEDAPFDVIKLPSEGLLYPNTGSSLKVAYLNAMDENIITNPNLLRSGKFLEVLINRKMIGTDLRYKDLHVGDRNAIMIWLRSTGYGSKYKIVLGDPENDFKEFEAEIDLSELPIKNLKEKPDENGHFTFILPISGKEIKFRLLNVGDVENIEEHIEKMTEEVGPEFTDASTYTLKKQILAVENDFNSETVSNFIEKGMRIGDVRAFRMFVNDIESGVDMNITVGTPGGGSVKTFLPLNTSFFWPDLGV